MLPTPFNYVIFPSVIPADKKVNMTICAAEPAFIMPDGTRFLLNVISVYSDENYYDPQNLKKLDAIAKDGMLSFEFLFEGEGEHLVQLIFD